MKHITYLVFLSVWPAACQSLIVGIPSADVAPKGEFALAHETQFNRFQSGTYWNSFTFATYGIGRYTELATSLYGVSYPGSGNRAIGFGTKTSVPLRPGSRWEPKASGGFMIPMSLNGAGTGYWFYGNASLRIPGPRTRITVGPSYGTRQIFGRRTYSTMVGIEQPVTRRWSVVSDWFSGTNDLGAAIFALSWQKDRRTLIIFGYKVANNARSGRPAFMIEVARTFGGH
ncbi:MAG: hypothetical protein JNK87_12325 [Bryobacterales bacterium]|nr:hypothetical protein [Bryobacterales bacterium]